eukprot:maker-scaffold_14-snap-gene-5.58-mRNA-1 protein AED:0.31 eAED:0.32 QI:0/0/0/1/1/1/2/0/319
MFAPMNCEYDDEEEDFALIILDCGSNTTSAGFGGDDASRAVFRTVCCKISKQKLPTEEMYLVGDQAVEISNREGVELHNPICTGVVVVWTELEAILHHAFYNLLKIDPGQHPILVAAPPLNPKANRLRIARLLLMKFGFSGVYFGLDAILDHYSQGRINPSMYLHSGADVTTVTPMMWEFIIPHAIKRINLGGRDITKYLERVLKERDHLYYVSTNFVEDLTDKDHWDKKLLPHKLNDGQLIFLGTEKFKAPEILFKPFLIGREDPGISDLIFESWLMCSIDVRSECFYNIRLSGGNTLLRNMKKRINSDLDQMFSKKN